MTGSQTKVVQITNIAPQATKDQMLAVFSLIGKVEDLRLYPTIRDVSCPVVSRICYVKFQDASSVAVAQHMTNTVLIDRALIVIPVHSGNIPDEFKAIEMLNNGTLVPGLHSSASKLPPECVNRIEGNAPNQVITTSDPKLEIQNLPKYPSLPVNFDAKKIEETRRTIMVIDIDQDWVLEDMMDHFEKVGEVKYGRLAEKDGLRHVMIEFSDQKSVIEALKLQGTEFKGVPLDVYHCTEPILKPQAKSNEAAQKEIEEAMCIVKEAQSLITAAIDPVIGLLAKDKVSSSSRRRSRSRSRERRRSRSRSRKRSKSRKRSRSRTRRSKRSRSRSRRRSRSRSKRSSRSRSKRSPSRRSRSRTRRSKERRKKSKSRQRSRSKSHSRRRSRSRSRDKKSSSKRKEEKRHRRSKSRSKSRKRSRSRTRKEERKSKKRSSPESKRDKGEKIKRDYDDEEKIGLEEALNTKKRGAHTPSPAKTDSP